MKNINCITVLYLKIESEHIAHVILITRTLYYLLKKLLTLIYT